MQKHTLLGIFFLFLTLLSCKSTPITNRVNENLLAETWTYQVPFTSKTWQLHANPWYLTGDPNQLERRLTSLPTSTVMAVKVPHFSNLEINGNFEVQIVGGQIKDSIYILGSNINARQIVTRVNKNTVAISPIDPKGDYSKVIVRIGISDLKQITNLGNARIWGRQISSKCLIIKNCNNGCIVLDGQINVKKIMQLGTGSILITGACSPCLNIIAKGNGDVKVAGKVNVQSITHEGNGKIHIVGAYGNLSLIRATCNGLITVAGCVNLKEIYAAGKSRVYVNRVISPGLYITAKDNAYIGLSGSVDNIDIHLKDQTRFYGKYLKGNIVYIKTLNNSHANIYVINKLFAASDGSSSLYFYGTPHTLSRFASQNAVILPVW